MGEVIRFPDAAGYARAGRYVDSTSEPATVIILPVIRIERLPDGSNGLEPDTGNSSGRRSRRRADPIGDGAFCARGFVAPRRLRRPRRFRRSAIDPGPRRYPRLA